MPRWYTTLFLTDTLERFGYYGMQAILVLYAIAPAARGGLGLPVADAGALFGAWISVIFLLSLPGGWIGDRLSGQWRGLLAGCVLSILGYACLALPGGWPTAIGLVVLAAGGGLFKPNHQAMINLMFSGGKGRESGISLMYVGVQVSALAAPLLTGYLAERVSWHLGFSVAAVAVLITGVLLVFSVRRFNGVGAPPVERLAPREKSTATRSTIVVAVVVVAGLLVLGLTGRLHAMALILLSNVLSIGVPVLGFLVLYRNRALGAGDRRRLRGYLAVCLGTSLFWIIIGQAASVLTLFAVYHTDLHAFGGAIPASWLQAATPAFILILAPIVAAALPRFGGRGSVAGKLSVGLLVVGGGFVVMSIGAAFAVGHTRISPLWLVLVYLLNACGELIISAVSISSAAEVLPRRFMGRVIGLLWLFAALGGGAGSLLVRLSQAINEPLYFLGVGGVTALVGVLFWLCRGRLGAALAADQHQT
jgi:POT family proton-dependent oligopeptide transporter